MKNFKVGNTVMFPDPSEKDKMILGQVLPESIMKSKIVNNQIHYFMEYEVEPIQTVYGVEKYKVDSDEMIPFNGAPPTPIEIVIEELCVLESAKLID